MEVAGKNNEQRSRALREKIFVFLWAKNIRETANCEHTADILCTEPVKCY